MSFARRLGPFARPLLVQLAVPLALAACGASPEEPEDIAEASSAVEAARPHKPHKQTCAQATEPGVAGCHAHVVVDARGEPDAALAPYGYTPKDLQAAYALPSLTAGATAGSNQVVAVVDAYDYPNAEADLGVYRQRFGLPPCTRANGCFRKVNQAGAAAFPAANTGWSEEAALDIQMVSAICPACKIILVEATTSRSTDLALAVDEAVKLGATVVTNSYGAPESAWSLAIERHYDHPGVSIVASSGDSGYGVQFPASSRYVTAVGGTSLVRTTGRASARGFTETAWAGAGSGCSAYVPKPAWQLDRGCAHRSVADVAAVADPHTGVAVYWTSGTSGGWLAFGGTSVAAPIIGAVYALAGNARTLPRGAAYTKPAGFFDVTSGTNGTCTAGYLCTAGPGYDGPTGLGTPRGVGAF